MSDEMEELRDFDITDQMHVRVCWRGLGQRASSRRVFIVFIGHEQRVKYAMNFIDEFIDRMTKLTFLCERRCRFRTKLLEERETSAPPSVDLWR